jgi:hypothetical protein
MRRVFYASLILLIAIIAAAQSGDPILGRWTLSAKSRFIDRKDRVTSMSRIYQRDGDKIKVSWKGTMANGKSLSGSYSAKCDGTTEAISDNAQIQCQHVNRRRVDGEITNSADPDHRYFTQQVDADGKTMNLIWYKDADRKQVKEVLMFNRAS